MTETEKVVLLIPGLADPENAAKAGEVLDKRNQADYQCYMVLRDIMEDSFILREKTDQYGESLLERAKEAIQERETLSNQYVELLCGRAS